MKLTPMNAALCLALSAACLPAAHAGYGNYGGTHASDFVLLTTAWTLGGGVRSMASNPLPGSANWSIMTSGLVDASGGLDPHAAAATTLLSSLYAGGVDEVTTIGLALSVWSAVSGFVNLGMVADGGGGFGAAGVAGGVGHIRVGAVFIDGAVGPNILAHAFSPCNATSCGFGGNLGGDTHFDNSNSWSDGGAGATIDFFTVALHEFGHALGLGHSLVVGSVMEDTYAGVRRTLHADDILGITTIYGPIPEPSTYLMMLAGVLGLAGYSRKRVASSSTPA